MAAKKRKETPQSVTLHDFFAGKTSSSSNARNVKKARLTGKSSTQVKREVPDEVIVIDSDEDEVSLLPSATKAPKVTLLQDGERGRTPTPILADLSAPAYHSSELGEADGLVEGTNIKSELVDDGDDFGSAGGSLLSGVPRDQFERDREPSLFGFPSILATQDQSERDVAVPPKATDVSPLDCSHDGVATPASIPPLFAEEACDVEDSLLGNGDWDTGDDEMELFGVNNEVKAEETDSVDIDLTIDVDAEFKAEDRNSVDLDLTLEDDDDASGQEKPVESCPICDRELVGLSTLVRRTFT